MRFKWAIVVVIILSVILALIYFGRRNTPMNIEELLPGNYKSIDKVQIVNQFDSIHFYRADSSWNLEGEKLDFESVESLILAAANLRMNSIIPINEITNVEYKAEFTFADGNKVKGSFTFLKANNKYYIFEYPAAVVYGVELPGYEDYSLEKIFSVNIDHYKQHVLLSLLPTDINSVNITPLEGDSFSIIYDGKFRFINQQHNEDLSSQIDTFQVKMFLSYFNVIRYEEKLHHDSLSDNAINEVPSAEVNVIDQTGTSANFEIYPWYRDGTVPDIYDCIVVFNDDTSYYYRMKYYYVDLLIRDLYTYLK